MGCHGNHDISYSRRQQPIRIAIPYADSSFTKKGALIGSFQTVQLDRYLKISKHCGQIGMLTATKQLDVIHLSEKQATPFSCRIFSFTMLLPNFHPVYLQHSSFKQGLFFKVSILLKKIFHYNQSEKFGSR